MTAKSEGIKKKTSIYKTPKWMDCSWKRLPCGKDGCKICGPISKRHTEHMDSGNNFETFEMDINEPERLLKKAGLKVANNSHPEDFPIVAEVSSWRDSVFSLISQAYAFDKDWVSGEATADLTWYANILCFKVFRQSVNRLELRNKSRAATLDYKYTWTVLKTCLRILKNATTLVYVFDQERRDCWRVLQKELLNLEGQILSI